MMWHFYEIPYIPDLELVKYQSLGEQGIDGILERHNRFLRQWQRNTVLIHTTLHFFLSYTHERPKGSRLQIFLAFSSDQTVNFESIDALMQASPLADYYKIAPIEDVPVCLRKSFANILLVKKQEQTRLSTGDTLFTVEGWKSNPKSRLYEMEKTAEALNEDMVYHISIYGSDTYKTAQQALQKPIAILREKALGRSGQITLADNKNRPRDVSAEETLRIYEEFLSDVAKSPCFFANILLYANQKSSAHFLMDAVCGEAIKEGTCEIQEIPSTATPLELQEVNQPYCNLLPPSLAFWPTAYAVRYADDFKIFCTSHADAVKAYKATELWLKDRLGLNISSEKSKVVNLKRQYSEFLGFKLKVRKKGKKYVVRSHMSDKAYRKAHTKITEEVAKLEHSSDDAQFIQLQKYNSVVAGLHEYYCIATEVSQDFGRLAFAVNKQLRNRLKGDLSKKGQLRNGFIKEKYGASKQLRFLQGRPIVPLGYVQPKNAQHKRKAVNKYTAEGRKQIHQNLKFNTSVMLWMMRNPVKSRTVEYADNRISLFAAQYGKCAITGKQLSTDDIHCHHKVPVSKGGGDEYANLILVSKDIHTVIHASTDETIRKYLTILKLDAKQLTKLNKLRTMAEMPQIIL